MSVVDIKPLYQLKGHHGSVLTIEYAKESFLGENILASGSEDNTCRLWDLRSKGVIKGIRNLNEPVTSIKFAKKPDSSLLYLSSGPKVFTYDLRNEEIILTEPSRTYEFSNDEINSIDLNDSNKFLATADDDGVVNVIDLNTHKLYKKFTKKHNSICMYAKFRSKRSWEVWSGGMDSKVYEWDFSRGFPVNIYDMNSKESSSTQMFNPAFVYKIETSYDGNWVAASLGDSTIHLLSPPNKKQKKPELQEIILEKGHSYMVNCLSFFSAGGSDNKLISGSVNGGITLWNPFDEDKKIESMYQVDKSIGRLNCLQVLETDDQIQIAAAGTSKSSNSGALHIYRIQ